MVKTLTPMPIAWQAHWDSFALGLESDGKSAETLRVYRTTVADFGQFLIDADVSRLLKTCEGGRDFVARRDYALLRTLLEGPRRGELASMRVGKLDLREGSALVSGKTGDRVVSLGKKAAYAIDRYLR